jgi:DNA-binding transcriptional MerR regulator
MYTVGRTAQLTGVPRETLRKWEQRYGIVAPARSEGNYRLYDDDAVRRLSVMRDLVDAGWSPRDAARRVIEGVATQASYATTTAAVPDVRTDALARCAEDFDADELERVLDAGFSATDTAELVDGWLLPSLVRLGEAWQQGRVTVAGEHFVSAAVYRRLARAFDDLPPAPSGAPAVIVGLARGSRHELGVLAFALVLRSRGVAVTYVGGDLPVEAWVGTTRRLQPLAVVLAVPIVEDLPAVREVVHALSGSTTVYLGGAFQDRVDGARPLGHGVGTAAARLAEELVGAPA